MSVENAKEICMNDKILEYNKQFIDRQEYKLFRTSKYPIKKQ